MSTLTKLVLGAGGQLRPKPAMGEGAPRIVLPAPQKSGGLPLIEAISKRHSGREFSPRNCRFPSCLACYGLHMA